MVEKRPELPKGDIAESDVPSFEFASERMKYDELPQLNQMVFRNARAITVEDRVYVQPYPESGHEVMWDKLVDDNEPEYDSVKDDGCFLFHISQSGDVYINEPELFNVSLADLQRVVAFGNLMDIDPEVIVNWSANEGMSTLTFGEIYDRVR